MTAIIPPEPVPLTGALPQANDESWIKIGEVARYFGISVDLLRLYERARLLIPLKSAKGSPLSSPPARRRGRGRRRTRGGRGWWRPPPPRLLPPCPLRGTSGA